MNIGPRIKYFRVRSGISQMDLELSAGMAFGSISRIESGVNHPSKFTLDRISRGLNLSDTERDYLDGSIALPASDTEISQAVASIKDHFNNDDVISYLCDERYRLIAFSSGFTKLLQLNSEKAKALSEIIIGRTLMELLIDKSLGLSVFFNDFFNHSNLKIHLKSYFNDVGFMKDDPIFIRTFNTINNDENAKLIWNEFEQKDSDTSFHKFEEKKVIIQMDGSKIELKMSTQHLYKQHRFLLTDFTLE